MFLRYELNIIYFFRVRLLVYADLLIILLLFLLDPFLFCITYWVTLVSNLFEVLMIFDRLINVFLIVGCTSVFWALWFHLCEAASLHYYFLVRYVLLGGYFLLFFFLGQIHQIWRLAMVILRDCILILYWRNASIIRRRIRIC